MILSKEELQKLVGDMPGAESIDFTKLQNMTDSVIQSNTQAAIANTQNLSNEQALASTYAKADYNLAGSSQYQSLNPNLAGNLNELINDGNNQLIQNKKNMLELQLKQAQSTISYGLEIAKSFQQGKQYEEQNRLGWASLDQTKREFDQNKYEFDQQYALSKAQQDFDKYRFEKDLELKKETFYVDQANKAAMEAQRAAEMNRKKQQIAPIDPSVFGINMNAPRGYSSNTVLGPPTPKGNVSQNKPLGPPTPAKKYTLKGGMFNNLYVSRD